MCESLWGLEKACVRVIREEMTVYLAYHFLLSPSNFAGSKHLVADVVSKRRGTRRLIYVEGPWGKGTKVRLFLPALCQCPVKYNTIKHQAQTESHSTL